MSITTDELRILLRVNGASTYTHTINEVTNVTNNYNKSCMSLMSTLAKLVSGAAIVKFGKQCIEAASNLQEVANVVDVTFGKNANVVNKWAKTQAANFGLSETAAKRYIGTYGTMAKQFNMTSSQAASMGIELTKLTGDVASFYNLEDKVAATKLKAIFTGETEGLKELGVVMTETQLNSYAMTKGLGKTTKEMSEQEKVLLRYQYTMEKLSHAQGDFARTSDGYANSVRGLKLQLENMKVEVGNELIPVAAMGIQAISKGLQAIAPIVISIARTIRVYAEAWKSASETTKTFVKLSIAAFAVLAIAPKIMAVTSAAVKLLTMDIVTLGAALKALLGIAGIVLAIAAVASLSKEVKNIGESAEVSTGSVDDLSESIGNLNENTRDLNLFLASFDEVNKVGGGGSLMSGLVTANDLNNILGASLEIEELQKQLDNLHMPTLIPEGVFTKKFWVDLGESVLSFFEEAIFNPGEFWKDWKRGFDEIVKGIQNVGEWIDKVAPKLSELLGSKGDLYDLTHSKKGTPLGLGTLVLDTLLDNGTSYDKSGSFKGENGYSYAKYKSDGSLSTAYEKYIRSAQSQTANKSTGTQTSSNTPIQVNSTIQLDGKTIASVVQRYQNQKTRSSGMSAALG